MKLSNYRFLAAVMAVTMVSTSVMPSFVYAEGMDISNAAEEITAYQIVDEEFLEETVPSDESQPEEEEFEAVSSDEYIEEFAEEETDVLTEEEFFIDYEDILTEEDAEDLTGDESLFDENAEEVFSDIADGYDFSVYEETGTEAFAENGIIEADDKASDTGTDTIQEEQELILTDPSAEETEELLPEQETLEEEAGMLHYEGTEIDNSTTLADGEYTSEQFEYVFTGGTGKAKLTCEKIIVVNGKATGLFTASSENMTHVCLGTAGSNAETPALYDPETDTCGENVYKIDSQQVTVPVVLNQATDIAARTTAMSEPHWVQYSYTITIAEPEQIELAITNNTGMFKAVTAYLEKTAASTELVMALSGSGYHELFKGTYEQAVANGANTDNWIHGAQNAEGKWEFRIPVTEGESYIPCVAISNSYYTKYLDGQNSIERVFYPRQIELDETAKTLVTGDYEYSRELAVTNNVKMFSVSGAKLDTTGGPNSNNYKADLVLTMGSTSFDKAYVGSAREAETAADTAAIGEGNTFALAVKWVETFGDPTTLKTWIGEPTVVSFHSVKKDAWYERNFTIDEEAGTLVIDEVPEIPERIELAITNNTGMFKAVTAYLEKTAASTELVMALSGSGYHELFKGTYEQAVANGANTDNWIHGAQNAEGKWEFRIPVTEGESYIPCVAISNSYYTKYLDGQNSIERVFYPRQIELDETAKTLVTGDYEYSWELAVTNNVKMFSVSGAKLDTTGGPNSNNYKADLVLTMGSTSFDKAYVGSAQEAETAADTAAIGEGNTFALAVKWVETFGDPTTLKTWIGEPTVVSFHSVKKDAWYERSFTIDEEAGTLVIDEVPEKIPETVTNVTETVQALAENITLNDKAGVEAARAAYDALTEEEKALVPAETLKKLTDAEEAIRKLEEEKAAEEKAAAEKAAAEKAAAEKAAAEKAAAEKKAANQAAAGKAADEMKSLPSADSVTVADKAAVEAARKTYNALTAEQKALVSASDLKKLTDAEAALKAAQEAEAKADEEPKVGDIIKTEDGTSYKVRKNNTVVYNAPANKKAASLTVPSKIKVNGKTYKVTAIKANAFKNNKKLKKVTIGANIKTIGKNAFAGCKNINSLKLGKNVTTIYANAFKNCKALKKLTISKNVKKIGANAFAGCTKISAVTFGKSVTSVGNGAFKGCKALKKVTLNKKLQKIGANTFTNCTNLKTVKIAEGTRTIGKNAFKDCKAIENIVLPKSLRKIEAGAFTGCTALKKVTIKSTKLSSIGLEAFTKAGSTNYKKLQVIVPAGKKTKYAALLKKAGLSKKAAVK